MRVDQPSLGCLCARTMPACSSMSLATPVAASRALPRMPRAWMPVSSNLSRSGASPSFSPSGLEEVTACICRPSACCQASIHAWSVPPMSNASPDMMCDTSSKYLGPCRSSSSVVTAALPGVSVGMMDRIARRSTRPRCWPRPSLPSPPRSNQKSADSVSTRNRSAQLVLTDAVKAPCFFHRFVHAMSTFWGCVMPRMCSAPITAC